MQQHPQTPQQPAASIVQHTPQTPLPAQANLASTFAAVIAGARECAPQHTPQVVAVHPPQPLPPTPQTVGTAGTGAIDLRASVLEAVARANQTDLRKIARWPAVDA